MVEPRKIFRVEETAAARREPKIDDNETARRHSEVMRELAALRGALAASFPRQMARGNGSAGELCLQADEITRMVQELDVVRNSSEEATQKILAAAEDIDQAANNLAAALKHEGEQGLAQDIRDRVIQIFEACNFQDLTSQRVVKAMATLNSIEGQLSHAHNQCAQIAAARSLHDPRLDDDPGRVSQDEINALFSGGRRSA